MIELKKLISMFLVSCTCLVLASCARADLLQSPEQEQPPQAGYQNSTTAEAPPSVVPPVDIGKVDGKILIFTLAYNFSHRPDGEYVYAETMAERYPDKVIHVCVLELPAERIVDWIERSLEVLEAEIRFEEISVVIFSKPIEENSVFVERINEIRPDIFVIELAPHDFNIAKQNYMAIRIDKVLGTKRCIQQAKRMGVENIVSFTLTWPGTINPTTGKLMNRPYLDIVREESEKHGIFYIEKEVPTPNEIHYPIRNEVGSLGRKTMFFSSFGFGNMNIPSIISGAVAIPIVVPDIINVHESLAYMHPGDYNSQEEKLNEFLESSDAIGQLAVWRIAFHHIALIAAVEYAVGYVDGEIESYSDYDALYESFKKGFEFLDSPNTIFDLTAYEGVDNLFYFFQEYTVY